MAKHRIRRWFQFGVLDLLMLVTIAAVVVVLWQPPRVTTYYEPLAEGTTPGQPWWGNGLRMKFRWCPAVTKPASSRVFRGGDWWAAREFCRSAVRAEGTPSLRNSALGFRVALVQQAEPGEQSKSKSK